MDFLRSVTNDLENGTLSPEKTESIVRHCISIFEKPPDDICLHVLACRILSYVLRSYFSSIGGQRGMLSNRDVHTLANCLNDSEHISLKLARLDVLSVCFKHVRVAEASIQSIHAKLVLFLEDDSSDVRKGGAGTFADFCLSSCPGGKDKVSRLRETWSNQMSIGQWEIHAVVQSLLGDTEHAKNCALVINDLPEVRWFPHAASDVKTLLKRGNSSIFVLLNLLRADLAMTVELPIENLIQIFKCVLGRKLTCNVDRSEIYDLLICPLMELLGVVIQCCSLLASAYSTDIISLLSVQLSINSDDSLGENSAKLRCSIYGCLQRLCIEIGPGLIFHSFIERLQTAILADSAPEDPKQSAGDSAPPPKRKRGSNFLQEISGSKLENYQPTQMKIRLIREALKSAEILISHCGISLPYKFLKEVQNFALLTSLKFQTSNRVVPYSKSVECRMGIYSLIKCLMLAPHPKWPPAIHPASKIIAQGRLDPRPEVAEFCSNCLMVCGAITHPLVPAFDVTAIVERPVAGQPEANGFADTVDHLPKEVTIDAVLPEVIDIDTDENVDGSSEDEIAEITVQKSGPAKIINPPVRVEQPEGSHRQPSAGELSVEEMLGDFVADLS